MTFISKMSIYIKESEKMPRKTAQPKAKAAPAKKGLAKAEKKPVGAPKMTNPKVQCKDSNKWRKQKRLVYGILGTHVPLVCMPIRITI